VQILENSLASIRTVGGGAGASEPIIRLKVNNEKFQGVLDTDHHIHLFPAKGSAIVLSFSDFLIHNLWAGVGFRHITAFC